MGKELIPAVLESIKENGNLRMSCRIHGVKPSTFMDWVKADKALAEQYADAREVGLDAMALEILDIADDGLNDTYVDEQGNTRTDHDVIARSRLRVDSRKWLLSKLMPKKYGDKIDITTQGEKVEGSAIHITREIIGGK